MVQAVVRNHPEEKAIRERQQKAGRHDAFCKSDFRKEGRHDRRCKALGQFGEKVRSGGKKKTQVKTVGKKSGGTQAEKLESQKTMKVINRLAAMFRGTRTVEKLPESAEDYSAEQIKMLITTYQDYNELSDEGRKKVEKSVRYPEFEAALSSLGERNHYDEATETDLRKNDEEALPWYVQLSVSQQLPSEEQLQEIRSVLGAKSKVFSVNEIGFVNLLTGEEWERRL